MMIGWIIIIPLILITLWYFNRNKVNSSAKKEKLLNILKKRFAAGEITSQEYEEQKAVFKK